MDDEANQPQQMDDYSDMIDDVAGFGSQQQPQQQPQNFQQDTKIYGIQDLDNSSEDQADFGYQVQKPVRATYSQRVEDPTPKHKEVRIVNNRPQSGNPTTPQYQYPQRPASSLIRGNIRKPAATSRKQRIAEHQVRQAGGRELRRTAPILKKKLSQNYLGFSSQLVDQQPQNSKQKKQSIYPSRRKSSETEEIRAQPPKIISARTRTLNKSLKLRPSEVNIFTNKKMKAYQNRFMYPKKSKSKNRNRNPPICKFEHLPLYLLTLLAARSSNSVFSNRSSYKNNFGPKNEITPKVNSIKKKRRIRPRVYSSRSKVGSSIYQIDFCS